MLGEWSSFLAVRKTNRNQRNYHDYREIQPAISQQSNHIMIQNILDNTQET